jgi:tetratricopeptide (TPR) repeat protein
LVFILSIIKKILQIRFMMKRFNLSVLILLPIILFSACVTTKKKGDASWAKRQFDNITTHYNYHFNANVLYEEAIAKLNAKHEDNYNKILDLYPPFAVENAKNDVGESMDKAVKKVSIAASIHQRGDWVDNCYLMMGKSQFLKQDYETSEETFSFLVDEFPPFKTDRRSIAMRKKELAKLKVKEKAAADKEKKKTKEKGLKEKEKIKEEKKKEKEIAKKEAAKQKEIAKKNKTKVQKSPKVKTMDFEEDKKTAKQLNKEELKKEEPTDELAASIGRKNEKPKNYFLKHRPSFQEGQIWLAKTYIERQKYSEANEILLDLLQHRSTFKDIRREAAKTYAYSFLKQKDYVKAVHPLEIAIELSKSKVERARMYYILGQIYQNTGLNEAALSSFEKVLKSRPVYEMEFNARVNVALFAYTSGKATAEQAIITLSKMTKDRKNEEYKDQVYYTMAQIALKNNDRKTALEYLQLSLNFSTKNQAQKAESYLQIAKLYFDTENYLKAKCYYDSSLAVLNKQDERYSEVKRYAFALTDVAKNIETIQLQDSLLRLGKMSPDERKDFATKKKKQRDEILAAAAAASIPKNLKTNLGTTTDFVESSVPSSFFAYNQKSLQSGKRSFQRKWGDRKLEDNWQRSKKQASNDFANDPTKNIAADDKTPKEPSDSDLGQFLQGVPTSTQEMETANLLVLDAMLNLGKAYREQLQKNEKCIKVLEEMNVRYPGSKNELESWYYLFLAHSELGQKPEAKAYYDKIVAKYPNTTYARILTDPNFAAAGDKEKRDLSNYYKATFDAFSKGQYKFAYENSAKADSIFGQKNTYKAKFALLNAMASGGVFGKEKYIALIKEVIAKFPETAEQKRAKEILRMLENNGLSNVSTSGSNDESGNGNFKVEDEAIHYIVVVVKDKKARLEEVKEKVGEFTREYYRTDNLKISNVFFGEESEIPLIVIRKFENREKSLGFFADIRRHEDDFIPKNTSYEAFPITQNNYKELLKSKDVNTYRTFFNKNYGQN